MYYYSENIGKIKDTYSKEKSHSMSKSYLSDFDIHIRSKVIAILLANAELATFPLTRENINLLFKGELGWRKQNGTVKQFNIDIDVEFLEKLGVVSFHANYCDVNVRFVRDEDRFDKSLKPVIDAIEILQDIKHGDDYVNPYFCIDKELAKKIIGKVQINLDLEQMSELISEGDKYKIIPSYRHGDYSLVNEYLWKEIVKAWKLTNSEVDKKSILEAINHWILISSVYPNCYFTSIELDWIDCEESRILTDNLIEIIESDEELKKEEYILINKWYCYDHFDIATPQIKRAMDLYINSDERGNTKKENITLTNLVLDGISHNDSVAKNKCYKTDVSYIRRSESLERMCHHSFLTRYFNLPSKVAQEDIYLDGNSINSHGAIDKLFVLSKDRPELRFILFNILPSYNGIDYLIYLLSRQETCAEAVYLFYQNRGKLSTESQMKTGFSFVCDEFFKVCFPDRYEKIPASHIVELIIQLATDELHNYQSIDIFKCSNISTLLNKFTHEQLEYISVPLFEKIKQLGESDTLDYWMLFLLFWILEKCQDEGVMIDNNLNISLQEHIVKLYSDAFNQNVGKDHYIFDACQTVEIFPWWRLDDERALKFHNIIPRATSWGRKLGKNVDGYFSNKNLTRNYFQILIALLSKNRDGKLNKKLANRIVDLLEHFGFSRKGENHIGLFDYESRGDFLLWDKFTLIVDEMSDDLFERILETIKHDAPIDKLLELYDNTNKQSRKIQLLDLVNSVSLDNSNRLGMSAIEESIRVACNTGQVELAKKLLNIGCAILDEKSGNAKEFYASNYFNRTKLSFVAYEFNINILNVVGCKNLSEDEKYEKVRLIENPFEKSHGDTIKGDYYRFCYKFKQSMLAVLLFENNPLLAYERLDSLYKQDASIQNAGNRFAAKLCYLDKNNKDKTHYRHANSQWLKAVGKTDVKDIQIAFVRNWFHCLVELNDHREIDRLWNELSKPQKYNISIATYYCKSLKIRGDIYRARSIFDDLRNHHDVSDLGDDAEKQLTDLSDLIIKEQEPSLMLELSTKILSKPKSVDELRRSYQEIKSQCTEDLVKILKSNATTLDEFLYEHVLKVINEIQLRKNNLNSVTKSSNRQPYRIIKEDLINDWFTSLFEHRLSDIGFSCRDQKRGGQAESKINPGEIDFYFCDSSNSRISIVEAFRLFSKDTTVIDSHLDKIYGYDQECLSPVFILAYCDVNDFSNLYSGYKKHTLSRDYKGFYKSKSEEIITKKESSTLAIYKEMRMRGSQEVEFYHILVNLRFA